jgi:hypothetical protein
MIPQFEKNSPEFLYVYKDGKAIRHKISTGYVSPDFIEIHDGVQEGDQIIVPLSGYNKFKNSNEITVKE